MITREADYAIRAILYMSQQADKQNISTADLSKEMLIPYRFLRKIVLKLVAGGILISRKGKHGGLNLAKKISEISVYDVIQAIDDQSLCLNNCLMDDRTCELSGKCPVHNELKCLQQEIDRKMKKITFDKLRKKKVTLTP